MPAMAPPRFQQAGVAPQAPSQQATPLSFRKATIKKRSLLPTFALNNAGGTDFGQQYAREIDSKGYMARLRLLVTGSETTTTADPTASADWPYNLATLIEVRDSAGGMLVRMKGYSAHLAERFFTALHRGSAVGSTDAEVLATAVSSVAVNQLRFGWDIWIETNSRDNLGLVPNQNAAFKYTISLNTDVKANLVTTAANFGTLAVNLQPEYEYYTVPSPVRADGRPQQVAPPFAGIVRQQWDETQAVPSAAENQYKLTPGKIIRNLALVGRNVSGVRVTAAITRIKFMYGDDTLLFDTTGQEIRERNVKLFNQDSPAGVYAIPFTDDAAGYVNSDFRRDLVDTRALSQVYMLITTAATVTQLDIVHDELIAPNGVSL